MTQWINLNRNYRSVVAHRYSTLWEKKWARAPTASGSYGRLAGWLAGWQADEMLVDFKIFKILYKLNYSDFYFV